jgi:uncharacterized membrane-anchored protein
MQILKRALWAFAAIVLGAAAPALAENPDPQKAWDEAVKAAVNGPSDVPFGDQAVLHLPSGYAFIPKPESVKLMEAWGNSSGEGFYGLIAPTADGQAWIMTVDHTAEGYVKDDDAKTWDAEALLQSLKDGTAEQNKKREELGIKPLDVTGWIEKPAYDATDHRLVWSLRAVSRGAPADEPATVNYNTYALGRDGYFQLDLLTNDKAIATEKKYAKDLIAALQYNQGKRYEDFNASTDHVAEYGLAALIGVVAAKKLGLLALAGVFILKFAKIFLVGAAVFGAAIFKFFRGKKAES